MEIRNKRSYERKPLTIVDPETIRKTKSGKIIVSWNEDYDTAIPNNLYKAITLGAFSGVERAVIDIILFKSIWYSNIYETSISRMSRETGYSWRDVKSAVDRLRTKNVIWITNIIRVKNGREIGKYEFNIYFESWNIDRKQFKEYLQDEIRDQPSRMKEYSERVGKTKIKNNKKKYGYKH